MTADEAVLGALRALAAAIDELGAPAMIIGGMALIARGVPRQTVDIDAAIWAEGLDLEQLVRVLAHHAIVPRIPDATAFARERQTLLLRHDPSRTPLEIILAWLPFERDALARATPVAFGAVVLPVATAEDLVVFKAVAWRDRDRADIERLLTLHGRSMNLSRVRGLVRQFAEALDEPERPAAFEAIVTRALGDAPKD
jgi:hypothetical protein